jgi:hypothetical protein
MSVYVDAMIGCLATEKWRHTRVAHLIADTEQELTEFAKRIGCKPHWVQRSRTGVPHFDVTIRMRNTALAHGALIADRKKVVEIMRKFNTGKEA